jgi:hypothetical protein
MTNVQTIQERINALGIGLEVWVDDDPLAESDWRDILDRNEEPTDSREYNADELGYGRLGDGWALLVRRRRYIEGADRHNFLSTDAHVDDPRTKPLLRASRELRVGRSVSFPN